MPIEHMNTNQKGFINVVLIVLVMALAGAVGYFVLTSTPGPATQQTITPPPVGTPTPTPHATPTPVDETADWKTHRNPTYGLEIKYPPTWNLKDNSLGFAARNGYAATFGIEGLAPVARDFTIDEMRKEYDRVNTGNPRAPKASQVLKDIFIGSETGLEWAGIACEQGNPCYARYEFYSNSTWRKGFKFYLVVPNLKSSDVNSSYDPRPLFSDDIATVRKVLSTFTFVD